MKLLKEISDATFSRGEAAQLGKSYIFRKSARAILKKDGGTIAVQYLGRDKFHKLPGGGIEQDETPEDALRREVKEEVGCDIAITKDLGVVIEYRAQHGLLAISYCFEAEVKGDIGMPQLEQGEIDEGMITVWMTPEETLEKMKLETPTNYQGPFILEREKTFLEEYLKNKMG